MLALAACGSDDASGTPGTGGGASADPGSPPASATAATGTASSGGGGGGSSPGSGGTGAGGTASGSGSSGGAGGTGAGAVGVPPGLELIPDLVDAVRPSVVAIGRPDGGEGSGVIWSADGVIVTNFHVVEGVDTVVVAYADGSRDEGTVEAADPRTDLAVVRVPRADLPAATFRDELPRVGELALAIGNPLGFEESVTAGIVSGLGRSIPGSATVSPALVDLIQTDAPISPGNSGGALVGGDGRIIGINVAYIPPEARAVSIGFAIPAPTAVDVVTELIEDGRVEHAYLGVQPATLDRQTARAYGLPVEEGSVVLEVVPGSPADRAGMQPGDIVVAIDDEPITSAEDLLAVLRGRDPGDEIELTVVRDDGEETLSATLADLPD